MEYPAAPTRYASRLALAAFVASVSFHFWGAMVGWESKSLPGVEFRQAQTALSAFFIKQENNFSLAYPTPVLGKPWSIPLEFPLYQWTVVGVCKVTGLGLTKSGRLVSLACFYLTLPALFLLLGSWSIAPGRRWLVLAVVVTCPFYIFYSRAFLIETMALMFSVWFWVAFRFAVEQRSKAWLALALLAGSGAGLVKVTTFMLYLLPVAGWALSRLWRSRHRRQDLVWMAGMAVPTLVLTFWWIHFADATKANNPLADFLLSGNLSDFSLGTTATRFSAVMWKLKWRIVVEELSWIPVIGACAVLAVIAGRGRWRELGLCLGLFCAALMIFPVLYAYHDYYYAANAILLMLAMGLAIVGLSESGAGIWPVMICLMVVCVGQAYRYFQHFYPEQRTIRLGGDALSFALRNLTEPGDVLIVVNQDWNPMLPYYAQRRAVMIRQAVERNEVELDAAFAALSGETIGALVISKNIWDYAELIRRTASFGLETKPSFFSCGMAVFLPETRHHENIRRLQSGTLPAISLPPGIIATAESLAGQWRDVGQLDPASQELFRLMRPRPARFYSTFGPSIDGSSGQLRFGTHPVTRLVFHLSAGNYVLLTSMSLSAQAYDPSLNDDLTSDGVEITLTNSLARGKNQRLLYRRLLDPRKIPADRGNQPVEISFTMLQEGEIELFFGPGPQNKDTRDWISMGELEIRKLN